MSKKKEENVYVTEEVIETLDQSAGKLEQFIEKNQKLLLAIVVGFFVVIGVIWAYKHFIVDVKEKEAAKFSFTAKNYFEQDSLKLALKGDGINYGFEDIAKDFAGTASGNIANYFAGKAHLKLGNFKESIQYLQEFESDDEFVAAQAKGLIGDAFSEITQYENAYDYYIKAAELRDNLFTTPMYLKKAGLVAIELGKKEEAIAHFQKIVDKYPTATERADADKYIAFLSAQK